MKRARAICIMYDLECPECRGLSLQSPNGSLNWSMDEPAPETAECADCGAVSKLPGSVPGRPILFKGDL